MQVIFKLIHPNTLLPKVPINNEIESTKFIYFAARSHAPVDRLAVDRYEPDTSSVQLSWTRVDIPPYRSDDEPLMYMLEYQEPPLPDWKPLVTGRLHTFVRLFVNEFNGMFLSRFGSRRNAQFRKTLISCSFFIFLLFVIILWRLPLLHELFCHVNKIYIIFTSNWIKDSYLCATAFKVSRPPGTAWCTSTRHVTTTSGCARSPRMALVRHRLHFRCPWGLAQVWHWYLLNINSFVDFWKRH